MTLGYINATDGCFAFLCTPVKFFNFVGIWYITKRHQNIGM